MTCHLEVKKACPSPKVMVSAPQNTCFSKKIRIACLFMNYGFIQLCFTNAIPHELIDN